MKDESTVDDCEGELDTLPVAWKLSRTLDDGEPSGRPVIADMSITMPQDKSLTKLFQASDEIDKMTLT